MSNDKLKPVPCGCGEKRAKDINVPNKSVENIYSVGDHDKIYVYGSCPHCGSAVIKPDKYCSECGARLEWG